MLKPPKTGTSGQQRHLVAIALMCGSVTVFGVLDTLAKYLSTHSGLPVMQVVWVRFFGNIILNLMLFGPLLVKTVFICQNRWLHFGRSVLMAGATGFNFLALHFLQLDQTVTLFFMAPLLIAGLGGPLLGEWIGRRRLLAILVGFSGVLFITRPGFGGLQFAMLYSLGAVISYALYILSTRYLTRIEPPRLAQVSSPLAGFVLFLPPALLQWQWPADLLTWVMLGLLGFIGGFAHWLLVLAHKYAPAPLLAPFVYVGLPSMTLLGWLVFGDVPSWWTLLGASIIMLAGGYLLWREAGDMRA